MSSTGMTRSALRSAGRQDTAVQRHARASADYDARLAAAQAVLRQAAASGQVAQASSLGVEDVVITDIIRRLINRAKGGSH